MVSTGLNSRSRAVLHTYGVLTSISNPLNNKMGRPGHTAPDAFACSVMEDHLQCSNQQTQEEVSIAIDNIVCILPISGNGESEYSVLFLETQSESSDPQATSDYTRVARIKTASLPSTLLSRYLCRELPRHLDSPNANIHVVLSTCSGTGKAKKVFQDVLQPFLSYLGLTGYEVHETQSAQTITELTRSKFLPCAQLGVHQTIILLSGDGGLVDIVDSFYSSAEEILAPPCIALIPTGTGNAMANSIGLLRPEMKLVILLQGKPTPMPVFAASFSPKAQYVTNEGRDRAPICNKPVAENQDQRIYGAVVASWGIHAALVADSDTAEYRGFGADRFKLAAKELLSPSDGSPTHRYRGMLSLTKPEGVTKQQQHMGSMQHDEHMYVLATLVSRLERGFTISPDSSPLDGCLRIVHFGPMPPEEAMRLMSKAYQGGLHVDDEAVTYTEIEGFRIDFRENDERWRRVCIDGKIVAVEQGGWMEVHREPRCLLNLVASIP